MSEAFNGRFVIDTNALVSSLLLPQSIPAQAVSKAINSGELLFSVSTLNEIYEVLGRPKFDRYLTLDERDAFMQLLSRLSIMVDISNPVTLCRDPKDNKFLEVAFNGQATALVSGDADLLSMHPFRSIPILSPKQFLEP